jgi:hypothetical protein
MVVERLCTAAHVVHRLAGNSRRMFDLRDDAIARRPEPPFRVSTRAFEDHNGDVVGRRGGSDERIE